MAGTHSPAEDSDGSLSWAILASATFTQIFVMGVYRSFGVVFAEITAYFGVSRETGLWPFSLSLTLFLIFGFPTGIMVHHLGPRRVSVVGGVLCFIGLLFCYFFLSIMSLTICFGIMYGIGSGLVCFSCIAAVNTHFKKSRGTANAIFFGGPQAGSIIFSPLMEYLIATFGLRDCFLIAAGIGLNVIPLCSLLHRPYYLKTPKRQTRGDMVKRPHVGLDQNNKASERDRNHCVIQSSFEKNLSAKTVPECVQLQIHCPEHTTQSNSTKKQTTGSEIQKTQYSAVYHNEDKRESSTPPYDLNDKENRTAMCKDSEQEPCIDDTIIQKILHNVREIKTILVNPLFLLGAFSLASYWVIVFCYAGVIVDYAMDRDIPRSAASYFMVAFSVCSLIVRVPFGRLTDGGYIKKATVMSMCFFMVAVVSFLEPLCKTFALMMVLASLFGVFDSPVVSLLHTLLAEYHGVHSISLAVGLSSLFMGFGAMACPSLTGVFRDKIGSYDGLFYLFGCWFVILSGIWLLEGKLRKRLNIPQEFSPSS